MDIQAPYYRQVALLMQVLPYVAVEREFALKGGTAINLFIRDFPRLSVDIDLAWVPLESRAIALPHIRDALARIAANLQQQAGMSAVLQANRSDEMRVIVTPIKRTGLRPTCRAWQQFQPACCRFSVRPT